MAQDVPSAPVAFMPVRCILDGESVHSFAFSAGAWSDLKATYRGRTLCMPCCGNAGIPKTSVRGTQFFAHGPNSGCPYVEEPAGLLTARIIIAQAVIAAGWEVITEYRDSEEAAHHTGWTADVYAHRGTRNVAFQVQWLPVEMDTIRARQAELKARGVRGAWFYRLYRNRVHHRSDLLDEYETPLFGIRITEAEDDFRVPRYDVALGEFVVGMLDGQLKWSPKPGEPVNAGIYVEGVACWKCGKRIGIPVGISFRTLEGFFLDFQKFHDEGTGSLIASLLDDTLMAKHQIGPIAPRFSKTARQTYLANGCYHCGALQGEFHVRALALELGPPESMRVADIQAQVAIGAHLARRTATWRFRADPGMHLF
jgi:hypothetical protein